MAIANELDVVYRYDLETGEVSTFPITGDTFNLNGMIETSPSMYGDLMQTSWVLPGNLLSIVRAMGEYLRRTIVDLSTMNVVSQIEYSDVLYPFTSKQMLSARPYVFGDTVVEVYNDRSLAAFSLTTHDLLWSHTNEEGESVFVTGTDDRLYWYRLEAYGTPYGQDWLLERINPHTGAVEQTRSIGTDYGVNDLRPFGFLSTVDRLAVLEHGYLNDEDRVKLVTFDMDTLLTIDTIESAPTTGPNMFPEYSFEGLGTYYSPISDSAIVRFSSEVSIWVDFTNLEIRPVPSGPGRMAVLRDGSILVTNPGGVAGVLHTDRVSTDLPDA